MPVYYFTIYITRYRDHYQSYIVIGVLLFWNAARFLAFSHCAIYV